MSDIELLLGLSSSNLYPPSSSGLTIDALLNEYAGRPLAELQQLHYLQAEIEKINNLNRLESQGSAMNSQPWSSGILRDSLNIVPSNTPVESPRNKINRPSTPITAIAVASLHSMKNAPTEDDFIPKVLFYDDIGSDDELNEPHKIKTVSEILKRVKYNHEATTTTGRSIDLCSSSPPASNYKSQPVSTSAVSNSYTHHLCPNHTAATSFEYTFNDSCAPNTTLIDSTLIQGTFDFNIDQPSPLKHKSLVKPPSSSSSNKNDQDKTECAKSPGNSSVNLLGYGLEDFNSDIVSRFPISSSPISKFETKFPEPRLITELFGLDENDFTGARFYSHKKDSITELKVPLSTKAAKPSPLTKLNTLNTLNKPNKSHKGAKELKVPKESEVSKRFNILRVASEERNERRLQEAQSLNEARAVSKPSKHMQIKKCNQEIDSENEYSNLLKDLNEYAEAVREDGIHEPKEKSRYGELIPEPTRRKLPTVYDLQSQKDSSLRADVSPKKKKVFRLEVDPENIISNDIEWKGRILREYKKQRPYFSYEEIDSDPLEDFPKIAKHLEHKHILRIPKPRISKKLANAPRSKSGCWTCRIRKKKCSEQRPECEQCSKLELECDGYSIEKPEFMRDGASQRKKLDQIKKHTTLRKKVGVQLRR